MTSIEYTRTVGRQLTYRIDADNWGGYRIRLGQAELLRGRDRLAAEGLHCAPNKRKAAGAVHLAKQEIESLGAMNEI